jgi:hypothetical protein
MTSPVPETAATTNSKSIPTESGPLQNQRTILAVVCVSG